MKLSSFLPNVRACQNSPENDIYKAFAAVVGLLNVQNVFNPSFYCKDCLNIFTFRAATSKSGSINSFLVIDDGTKLVVKNISADLYQQAKSLTLLDPKLFRINDEIYVCLHSGWVPDGNDIYVIKVYPEIGDLKRLVYAGRQAQERNWAFFSENEEIYALYSIRPLRILKLDKVSSDLWEFKDYYLDSNNKNKFHNRFTIGTQLVKDREKYYFIAHKKLRLLGKKIYLGMPCMFDFNNRRIDQGVCLLVHSLKSMLGSKIKHNTNLLSCTYFSGIQLCDGLLKLGYGINDIESGFAQFSIEEFFKY